jgi:hypothetical protein
MTMIAITRQLAEFAADLEYDALPDDQHGSA